MALFDHEFSKQRERPLKYHLTDYGDYCEHESLVQVVLESRQLASVISGPSESNRFEPHPHSLSNAIGPVEDLQEEGDPLTHHREL